MDGDDDNNVEDLLPLASQLEVQLKEAVEGFFFRSSHQTNQMTE